MQRSPLEFSRFWADLMAAVDNAPSADVGLLILTRLWDELKPFQSDSRYSPYLHEYEGRLDTLITAEHLHDFSIEHHEHLRSAALALSLHRHIPILATSEARLHAYVGDVSKAVELLCGVTGEKVEIGPLTEDLSTVLEMRCLETVIPRLEPSAPQAAKMLSEILAGWQAEASALSHDRAWCLLVQIGPHIHGPWGHLSELSGTVDLMRKKNSRQTGGLNDQVTFAHQLKDSNDPAIGGVYDSLVGVRKLLGDLGLARLARERGWAVRLQFEGNSPMLHGDSLGLAAGLVTFAGLMKEEFIRYERKLSGEVGYTGGLDADGHLTAVNDATLRAKVERAFYSHLKYLVLPKDNEEKAASIVRDLTLRHPSRKMHIVTAETLVDVVENRNIVRSEKLCPGVYILKGTRKYSRATKVQVPLLAALVLLFGFIIADQLLPECVKPWGDCNPAYAKFNLKSGELMVSNKDTIVLWKQSTDCPLDLDQPNQVKCVDLNGDGLREVLFRIPTEQECDHRDTLTCLSSDGQMLFKRSCVIPNQYPGDSVLVHYSPAGINVIKDGDVPVIITEIAQSMPGRSHIRFWTGKGDSLGTYINAGGSEFRVAKDINGDGRTEAIFIGYNNRKNCTAFFVLDPTKAHGVAPPYRDSVYDLSWVQHGNQIAYILFPVTDLGTQDLRDPYNSPMKLLVHESGFLDFHVCESSVSGNGAEQMVYSIDNRMRVTDCWPTDQFRIRRSKLVSEGELKSVNWSEYLIGVRNAVLYWTDSEWVSEGQLRSAGQ
jgi:hypothetical protein